MFERIGTLDLRDDKWLMPELFRRCANGVHVGGGLDERLAHGLDSLRERELETGAVMFGKGADAEIDAGKIESFPGTQFAADSDGALDVVVRNAIDHELHEAVIQIKAIAGFHHARQVGEAHRNALRISDDVFVRQAEMIAGRKLNRLRIDSAQAHLWSG